MNKEPMDQNILLKLLCDWLDFNPRHEQDFIDEVVELGYTQGEIEALLEDFKNEYQ
jgi:hypothetical protein